MKVSIEAIAAVAFVAGMVVTYALCAVWCWIVRTKE